MDRRYVLEKQMVARRIALGNHQPALEWLQERGLDAATIVNFKLGVYEDEHGTAINIPYINPKPYGGVRANRLRYIPPTTASHKYHTPRGQGTHIYNVQDVDAQQVYITEGEFDTMILKQMGFSSVAVPGSHTFKPEWAYLFVNADLVVCVADGDTVGEQAAMRMASMIGTYTDVSVVRMPDGMDVNSLYLKSPYILGRQLQNG